MKRYFPSFHNNRGVALLIVLLVTALLIALIFEFAYATRVSLRAAVNFRDSQRAYFLARAAVNVFAKYQTLQDNIPQGEWGVVPIVSEGDTELRIRWEDERGKINISKVIKDNDAYKRLGQFFDIREVSQDVLFKMTEKMDFRLITELHQVMSDEEFQKAKDYLTVYLGLETDQGKTINVNTASLEVLRSLLRSLGKDDGPADSIVNRRNNSGPFETSGDLDSISGIDTATKGYFTTASNIYKVYAYATVGGYTRQIEAVITRGSTTPLYWRVM